jgi:hypothetical protein
VNECKPLATGQSGALQNFPFDPAKLDSPATKVKEVKNARLAMMAFLGMVSQYAVTGTSPLEGLKAGGSLTTRGLFIENTVAIDGRQALDFRCVPTTRFRASV